MLHLTVTFSKHTVHTGLDIEFGAVCTILWDNI